MSETDETTAAEIPKPAADDDEATSETASEDFAPETAQSGVFLAEPMAELVENAGQQPNLRRLGVPGLSHEIDASLGDDGFPEYNCQVSPDTPPVNGLNSDPAAGILDALSLQAVSARPLANPTGFALDAGRVPPAITSTTRHQRVENEMPQVTEPSAIAEAKPQIDPSPASQVQEAALPESQAGPPASRFPEEAMAQPSTLKTGFETIAASVHHPQAVSPRAKTAATFTSTLAQNVVQQITQISPDTGRILIKLKPHGMGLMEMEISREKSGRHDIALRVQNSLVLEALRIDKQAILDLLGGHSAGATLDLDLYQSDTRARDQSDAEPAAQQREPAEAENEVEEPRRLEILTLGATNILI